MIRDQSVSHPESAVLHFIDNAGIARVKYVPASRLESLSSGGVGLSPIFGVLTTDDTFSAVPGLDPCQGDLRLRPDLAHERVLPGSPTWAWTPVDQYTQQGDPWPGCQRHFLRRMVARAETQGLTFLSAFELEWTAGRSEGQDWQPIHDGPSHGGVLTPVLKDHFAALFSDFATAGISVDHGHAEYGAGQLEVALGPTDPLVAADVFGLARQIIHQRSHADGWQASFAPLVTGAVGNGAHAHLSLWREGTSLFAPMGNGAAMHHDGESFLAGILAELPALTAIGSPLRISYERVKPGLWSGAWACWGLENREAALRLEGAQGPNAHKSSNVEWKAVDGAANPYLALGAMIAAGLHGMEHELRLPPPLQGDPSLTGPSEGEPVAKLIPQSIEESTDALGASAPLREALGDLLIDSVIATRRQEATTTASLSREAQIARSRRRY
ncbi:glutamine synthetase [Streptomyces sp. NBC_00878]|uniref:glutamine synthetase n=1 Tax=Streptomyces sp. NBC_00878 TaxID=2975854 RepID=UPI00224F1B53|nr:glutamine synthetase [Streptomyces sp. NBC_00878]MCX4910768.1 glutamine synthetase [Streptomyces sp. NBC_00878]